MKKLLLICILATGGIFGYVNAIAGPGDEIHNTRCPNGCHHDPGACECGGIRVGIEAE
ncbi:hypothetical protein K5X82_08085 [Halosquirtibacter xylanolyticus]|uniref:hypothetical protein n=1 Tax=Halosquirtibacter xylanolyticus TaxID=3374599 RepID=UPI00374A6B86|nr:hypothetical protein K5X82_08085 [Prolixibacteraceae bacterium]